MWDHTRTKTISESSPKDLLTRGEAIGQDVLVVRAAGSGQALNGDLDDALGEPKGSGLSQNYRKFGPELGASHPSGAGAEPGRVAGNDEGNQESSDHLQGKMGRADAHKLKVVQLKGAGEPGLRQRNAQHIIQNNIQAMTEEPSKRRPEGRPTKIGDQ